MVGWAVGARGEPISQRPAIAGGHLWERGWHSGQPVNVETHQGNGLLKVRPSHWVKVGTIYVLSHGGKRYFVSVLTLIGHRFHDTKPVRVTFVVEGSASPGRTNERSLSV